MPSKKTLNAKNLEALGAQRLAELLIEISTGDAAAKRLLRLELAGTESPKEVAREVRKRLSTVARSRAFVDWQRRKALVDDLETQRRAIMQKVAPGDPSEALDLMWPSWIWRIRSSSDAMTVAEPSSVSSTKPLKIWPLLPRWRNPIPSCWPIGFLLRSKRMDAGNTTISSTNCHRRWGTRGWIT